MTESGTGSFFLLMLAADFSAKFIWLLRSGFLVRNSFSDCCDITVKTIANLAKIGKSQVALAAFHSIKITSLQSAPLTKVLLFAT
jgi:hypothetical protein